MPKKFPQCYQCKHESDECYNTFEQCYGCFKASHFEEKEHTETVNEFEKCPFCNFSIIQIFPVEIPNKTLYYAECQGCFAKSSNQVTEYDAKIAWNTQPIRALYNKLLKDKNT